MRSLRTRTAARLARFTRTEVILWCAFIIAAGGLAAALIGRSTPREWDLSLFTGGLTFLSATQATCVTRRVDRMYRAMLLHAATTQAPAPEIPAQRRHLQSVSTGPQPRL